MPEGHVLHRAARLQGKRFNGRVVSMRSPQGRFADGARQLDGQRLDVIEAKGKHLFYRFETDDVLHVHLGLFGKFRLSTPPFPEPSEACRVLLWTDDDQLHLAGPNQCAVLDPAATNAILDRLGPDPILAPADGFDDFSRRLARRRIPIGKALMDQHVVAGIGNVYRAELLFGVGLDPFTPANEVPAETVRALWDRSVAELNAGERLGRIVTVDPDDADGGRRRRDLKAGERLYVYKRQGMPCRRCQQPIASADIDGRNVWWCRTCQS
jgi:endonuclease VIII